MDTLFQLPAPPTNVRDTALDQYFTPEWAAEALVSEFFPDLGDGDLVIEPSCGRGAFLNALPPEVPAFGVEIDPHLAEEARQRTGRHVVCGDFCTVPLTNNRAPTAVIGNPPFNMKVFDGFLERAWKLMNMGGRCGFLLPVYSIQTPARVLRWASRWSLDQKLVPRVLFPRAKSALVFLMFTKDGLNRMDGGFALYRQAEDLRRIVPAARLLLIHGKPGVSCWRAVVEWALRKHGGRASLRDLYDTIEPRRPT